MDSSLPRLLLQPRNWLPAVGLSILWLLNLLPYALKIRIGMLIGQMLYPLARVVDTSRPSISACAFHR